MNKSPHILLTGVTGFLGKVILEELVRRQEELGFEKISVLIRRGRKNTMARSRFKNEVVASRCFSKLKTGWEETIHVVEGDLSSPNCDLSSLEKNHLAENITHIINCAASVEFDLPLKEAATANVTSSLNVLSLAQACQNLASFVSVSTAYVTPFSGEKEPIEEVLAPLPLPAELLYRSILDGKADEKELLERTGQPNTYTLTKCLAEHLLMEKKGNVPLKLVRPSIISASWQRPFPGWIDSQAAFAGFVAVIGSGFLRAIVAHQETRLDVVPCDEVATRVIGAAFEKESGPLIRHAVAGLNNSCRVQVCVDLITNYFQKHPVFRHSALQYVGSRSPRFLFKEWQYHRAPNALLQLWYQLQGEAEKGKQVRRLQEQLYYLNRAFPYFTHNTFDFRSSVPLSDPLFKKERYVETVCRGVYRHLMKRDENQILFAGQRFRNGKGDLHWALTQPNGNWAIRLSAYLCQKAMKRCAEGITFDRPAFEAARHSIPKDHLMVIVPTHRSYLDFVLCSYLFFARPDLNIAIPHIAAAEEFSKIPVLGWLFKKAQAFYVKRGLGHENVALTEQVHQLVREGQTLEFFIEGTRSRSGQFLKPRRGLLKCLQATRQPCSILPVSITYDRVPEEKTFLKELSGAPKPKMRLRDLVGWVGRLLQGKVKLGRIHISCGRPLLLTEETDITGLSWRVMGELQKNRAVTTHHLRSFLAQHPDLELELDWLKGAIVRRGGHLIESPLKNEKTVSSMTEKTMQTYWARFFFQEARELFENHPAIQHYISQNDYAGEPVLLNEAERHDPRVAKVLKALFRPVCNDYVRVADALDPLEVPLRAPTVPEILKKSPSAYRPYVEAAFEALVAHHILEPGERAGEYQWGANAKEIENFLTRAIWPVRMMEKDSGEMTDAAAIRAGDRSDRVSRPTSDRSTRH
ncbi:MAG: SDR family oxidoreductase [bacterium]|nr:SDR family oxidoreductase [bacterium]